MNTRILSNIFDECLIPMFDTFSESLYNWVRFKELFQIIIRVSEVQGAPPLP